MVSYQLASRLPDTLSRLQVTLWKMLGFCWYGSVGRGGRDVILKSACGVVGFVMCAFLWGRQRAACRGGIRGIAAWNLKVSHLFLLRLGRIKLPGASEKLRRGSFMGLIALVPSYPSGEMEQ